MTIPFVRGADEKTAKRQLEHTSFREAVNVRCRRESAFGVRAEYVALATDAFDGTLQPYELVSLDGRVFALGDTQSAGLPTDILEYVDEPGGTWRGTIPVGGSGHRVPPVVDLRNMGQVPTQSVSARRTRIAAANGIVCMVYEINSTQTYVHIFRASTNSTLLFERVTLGKATVLDVADSLWIVGIEDGVSNDNLVGYRFDTLVDDNLQAAVTLYTGAVLNCDACRVDAATVSQFAVVFREGSQLRVRVFDEAGSEDEAFNSAAVAADVIGIHADAADGKIAIVYRVGSADAQLLSYNLDGTGTAGPTAVFGETVTDDIYVSSTGLSADEVEIYSQDASTIVRRAVATVSTATVTSESAIHGVTIAGRPEMTSAGMLVPVIINGANALLIPEHELLCALVDQGIAGLIATSTASGESHLSADSSTGKVYWSRLIEGTGGEITPVAAEMAVTHTRRFYCEIGGNLLLAGGAPLSFDAVQLVESGFPARPESSVAQAASALGNGQMLVGAEYDICIAFRWTDSTGRECKSPVSEITSVTMTTGNDCVNVTLFAPLSLKRQAGIGSNPVLDIYRTPVDAIHTTATLTARNGTDPPSSSLNGLELAIFIEDSGGFNYFPLTLDGTVIDTDSLVTFVNSNTTDLTATNVGGFLVLTADEEGAGVTLGIYPGSANAVIGFVDNESNTGTTTFVKGSDFHREHTQQIPTTDEWGQAITVQIGFDTAAQLLAKAPLYTQGEHGALSGILEHEAPPPFRFCATVGDRAFIGGLPDPNAVAISKALFPNEALAFSSSAAFNARIDASVTAVGGLDGVPIAFTADALYAFGGEQADDAGNNGQLGPPVRIPSEGGCDNQASVCETSYGLFYQSRTNKIMLLPRGGASPIWAGEAVQDALESFPNITGARFVEHDHVVCFACQNTAETASIILVFDLRMGRWFKDTFTSAETITSLASYQGRLAYIDTTPATNLVKLQSASLTPSSFIAYNVMTGSLRPWDDNGWGKLKSVVCSGEYRGDCRLRLRESYDDGVSFTTMTKVFEFLAADGYAAGDSFQVMWTPARRKGETFVLDFQVIADSGNEATEGLILNDYTLALSEPARNVVRLPVAQRG